LSEPSQFSSLKVEFNRDDENKPMEGLNDESILPEFYGTGESSVHEEGQSFIKNVTKFFFLDCC